MSEDSPEQLPPWPYGNDAELHHLETVLLQYKQEPLSLPARIEVEEQMVLAFLSEYFPPTLRTFLLIASTLLG